MANKAKLAKKLDKILAKELEKHGEPIARDLTVTRQQIRVDFRKWGIAIIDNPISGDAWEQYILKISCELSEHLFDTDDPFSSELYSQEFAIIEKKYPHKDFYTQMLMTFGKWWNSGNDFGNANFRFVFFQALEKEIKFQVGKNNIYFSRNPIYRWNLELLSCEPKLYEIMKSFHPQDKCIVSWDSAKVRINHPKATKPALTKRHRDIYKSNGMVIDRKQAMLIKQEPEAISLGWVVFSHLPKVQKILQEYFGKDGDQFNIVEDPLLNPIFDKYWRGTGENSFVVWEQHTVHYEAEPTSIEKGITRFKSFTQPKEALHKLSLRVAVGTQQPHGLSGQELKQLEYLAKHGFCPAIYNNCNKNTAVGSNTVNKKSTMWKKKRTIRKLEAKELEKARKNYF